MTVRIQRLLVGIDDSDNARRALDWAILLAQRFGAEVVAVHAVGLLTSLHGSPPVPSHSHLGELRRLLETEWCAPLAESGVPHRMLCLDGPPVRVLLDVAAQEDADVIVVGTRGAGGFAELLLGSTSHQLAEHATRPILIVPPANGATVRGTTP
ncbi:MAG TPA: universal stress protein [Acidimicrobiales bacterium]|nr:universal stress protein [Acidimicrobiales bacterium]